MSTPAPGRSPEGRAVAVVILNWNGATDTIACLDSFGPDPAANLIVVDNGSTDGSVEAIQVAHPDVMLIEAGDNLGFSAGNNIGIRYALDEGAEVIGILNNDTVVTDGFLDPLLREIDVRPAHLYVSPLIHYVDRPDDVWFGGTTWHPRRGIPVHERIDATQLPRTRLSDTVTGCALFAHRDVWNRVGLLDEGYFLIFEDAEWSVRANRAGAVGLVVNDSTIHHRVSSTITNHATSVSTYYYARNGVAFLRAARRWEHLPGFALGITRDGLRSFRRERSRSALDALELVGTGLFDGVRGKTGPAAVR